MKPGTRSLKKPKRPVEAPSAPWTPPPGASLADILAAARADAHAGRHDLALARHVWLHEHSLELDPHWVGVRLSFALGAWVHLAKIHPPALAALRSARDAAGARVRAGEAARSAFLDFTAINEALREARPTRDLFLWVEVHQPRLAREIYLRAQPALIKTREFACCGRHVRPDRDFRSHRAEFRALVNNLEGPIFARRRRGMIRLATEEFAGQIAALLVILLRNRRRRDAARILKAALAECDAPWFRQRLKAVADRETSRPRRPR